MVLRRHTSVRSERAVHVEGFVVISEGEDTTGRQAASVIVFWLYDSWLGSAEVDRPIVCMGESC